MMEDKYPLLGEGDKALIARKVGAIHVSKDAEHIKRVIKRMVNMAESSEVIEQAIAYAQQVHKQNQDFFKEMRF